MVADLTPDPGSNDAPIRALALAISAGGETGLVPEGVQSRPPGNIAHHKETP